MTFTWEAPPQNTRQQHWYRIADRLRERPGEWAKVATRQTVSAAGYCAWYLRTQQKEFKKKTWEVVSSSTDVYARYLGEQS